MFVENLLCVRYYLPERMPTPHKDCNTQLEWTCMTQKAKEALSTQILEKDAGLSSKTSDAHKAIITHEKV